MCECWLLALLYNRLASGASGGGVSSGVSTTPPWKKTRIVDASEDEPEVQESDTDQGVSLAELLRKSVSLPDGNQEKPVEAKEEQDYDDEEQVPLVQPAKKCALTARTKVRASASASSSRGADHEAGRGVVSQAHSASRHREAVGASGGWGAAEEGGGVGNAAAVKEEAGSLPAVHEDEFEPNVEDVVARLSMAPCDMGGARRFSV